MHLLVKDGLTISLIKVICQVIFPIICNLLDNLHFQSKLFDSLLQVIYHSTAMKRDEILTMRPKTIGEMIKKRRVEMGMTMEDLAKATGYESKTGIAVIENGKVENIPLSKVKALADALRISIEDFFPDVPSYRGGVLSIPFISQKLSAGMGIDHLSDADMEVEKIDILEEMARGLDKSTLVAARVKGDSMVDANINSGDIAIFSKGLINGEGIYVINYLGDVLIKRIQFDPKRNEVEIISANRNYPVKTASAEDVLVLGKVIGWFHVENY